MKNLKKKSLSLVLAGLAMTVDAADVSSKSGKAGAVHQISSTPWEGEEHLKLTSVWDKTFPESDKVDHTKVTFHNRYGITLAADLYMPKNRQGRMPALAVAGPFGAVKEQAAGIYAQKLAEMGFHAAYPKIGGDIWIHGVNQDIVNQFSYITGSDTFGLNHTTWCYLELPHILRLSIGIEPVEIILKDIEGML